VNESDYTCDKDGGPDGSERCYMCDNDGDNTTDDCYQCDFIDKPSPFMSIFRSPIPGTDGVMDTCYNCDGNGNGTKDDCCNTNYPNHPIPFVISGWLLVECSCAGLDNSTRPLWIVPETGNAFPGQGATSGIVCAKWYKTDALYDSMQAATAKPMMKIKGRCAVHAYCEGTNVKYKKVGGLGNCSWRVPRGEFRPVPPNDDYWPREPDPNNSTKSPKLRPECN